MYHWPIKPIAGYSEVADMFEKVSNSALTAGIVSRGDLVIITARHPLEEAGTTNMMKVIQL